MKRLIASLVCVLAGCGEPRPYKATFTRPDGVVHRSIVVKSQFAPHLIAEDGIVALRVWGEQDYYVPAGWMAEIEPLAEDTK